MTRLEAEHLQAEITALIEKHTETPEHTLSLDKETSDQIDLLKQQYGWHNRDIVSLIKIGAAHYLAEYERKRHSELRARWGKVLEHVNQNSAILKQWFCILHGATEFESDYAFRDAKRFNVLETVGKGKALKYILVGGAIVKQ